MAAATDVPDLFKRLGLEACGELLRIEGGAQLDLESRLLTRKHETEIYAR